MGWLSTVVNNYIFPGAVQVRERDNIYPDVWRSEELEENSKYFYMVPGLYIAGTPQEVINIGQSDVSMLGRLCHKKEGYDHQWWTPWCDSIGGMYVEPRFTERAQAIALEIHRRVTGLPHPRGHWNNS